MEGQATAGGVREGRRLRITWVKSGIGYRQSQRLTIKSLGLRKLNQTVEHHDTPSIRGMVTKVRHLVQVEEFDAAAAREAPAPRETGTQRFAARLQARAARRAAMLAELAELDAAARPAPEAPVVTGVMRPAPATDAIAAGAFEEGLAPAAPVGDELAREGDPDGERLVVTPALAVQFDPDVAATEPAEDDIAEGRTINFRPGSSDT
jgi:large subunit ribosomal protein L30